MNTSVGFNGSEALNMNDKKASWPIGASLLFDESECGSTLRVLVPDDDTFYLVNHDPGFRTTALEDDMQFVAGDTADALSYILLLGCPERDDKILVSRFGNHPEKPCKLPLDKRPIEVVLITII